MSAQHPIRSPRPGRHLVRAALLLLAVVAVGVATGCQPMEPTPTPTATRTPIPPTSTPTPVPSSTPIPTPTPTLTPSPTLPPDLVLPPQAAPATACPPLPADLFFLRDGQLYTCLAEGGSMEELPIAEGAEGTAVVAYRLAQDGRHIVYVTDAGELYLLDRASQEHTLLPTSGRVIDDYGVHIAITADARTVFYLGWGVQPTRGPSIEEAGSASLLAISATTPTARQQELALCKGLPERPCLGFTLSPDEGQIAMIDGRGIWQLDREAPEAPRLLGHYDDQSVSIRSWSPDGAWLLLETMARDQPSLVLLSTAADTAPVRAQPICAAPCRVGAAWGAQTLWVTWSTAVEGCIQPLDPTGFQGPVVSVGPDNPICQVGPYPLFPTSPEADIPLPGLNADLVFLQARVPGLGEGLYGYGRDESQLVTVALLPEAGTSAMWSPQIGAFLTMNEGAPAYVGVMAPPALWDVRTLLEGAQALSWGPSVQE